MKGVSTFEGFLTRAGAPKGLIEWVDSLVGDSLGTSWNEMDQETKNAVRRVVIWGLLEGALQRASPAGIRSVFDACKPEDLSKDETKKEARVLCSKLAEGVDQRVESLAVRAEHLLRAVAEDNRQARFCLDRVRTFLDVGERERPRLMELGVVVLASATRKRVIANIRGRWARCVAILANRAAWRAEWNAFGDRELSWADSLAWMRDISVWFESNQDALGLTPAESNEVKKHLRLTLSRMDQTIGHNLEEEFRWTPRFSSSSQTSESHARSHC